MSQNNLQKRILNALTNISNNTKYDLSEINNLIKEIKEDTTIGNNLTDNTFSTLFDNDSNAIATYKAIENGNNFVFVDFNTKAEKIENLKKKKVVGKKVTEVFPNINKFGLLKVMKTVWKTGVSKNHPVSLYEDDRIVGWRENNIYKLPSGNIIAVYRDLTEETQEIRNLQKSKSSYKALINNESGAMWSIDSDYNYVVFNDFFRKQYFKTYKIKLEVGINSLDLLTDDLYDFWKNKYDRALKGEKFSFEFSAKVGKKFSYFQVSLNPIISNKTVTGVSCLSIDITKQKLNEISLRESEEQFKIITQSSVDVIFRIDQKGKLLYFSESVEKILGYKPQEIVGKSFKQFLANSDIKKATSELAMAFAKKDITNFTTKIIHKNGELIDAEINGSYLEIDGKLIAQGSIRDISEQTRFYKILKESEEQYRSIFNNQKMIMLLIDPDSQKIIDASPGAEKFYGWTKAEFQKMKITQLNLLPVNVINEKINSIKKTRLNYFEFKHRKKDN